MPRLIILFLLMTSSQLTVNAQVDTVMYQRDSVIEVEDCTVGFFQRSERVPSMEKTKVVTKAGRTVSLSSFYKSAQFGAYAESGLQDMDGDGRKELVLFNFTGGAHCCDEIYFFKNIAPGKYQQVARLFGGNTCFGSDNHFRFSFYEQFGYFFTCFACTYEDTSDVAPIPLHSILLKYNKGKISIVPGDKELRSTINDNLAKLGEQPYEKLEDITDQDNGLRKEFALNLAVYYYSFGKNLAATQQLFNKYYQFADAKKVWTEFVKHLQALKKQNDF